MAAVEGRMREYETIYVLSPSVEDKAARDFMLKMKSLIETQGGKNIKVECLGRKKLAWLREKIERGIFVQHSYLGKPGIVKVFENVLTIEETVMLRQTVLVNENVDPLTRAEEQDNLEIPVIRERRDFGGNRYGRDDDMGMMEDWDMDLEVK